MGPGAFAAEVYLTQLAEGDKDVLRRWGKGSRSFVEGFFMGRFLQSGEAPIVLSNAARALVDDEVPDWHWD